MHEDVPHTAPRAGVADIAHRTILQRIISGEYAENSKLPTEAEFARELGISRPMVRAAIARLRDSGLVISRRGSGSYVLKRPSEQLLAFTPIESITDLQNCFEYRIMLEGCAAYYAAERAGPEDLERMEKMLRQMDRAIEERTLMLDADFAFHLAVCEAADNPFYAGSFQSISEASHAAINLALNLSLRSRESRLQAVQQEHWAVFKAIRAGDAEAARATMQTHLANARSRIFKGPER